MFILKLRRPITRQNDRKMQTAKMEKHKRTIDEREGGVGQYYKLNNVWWIAP